jgi:hypothetical protein
MLFLSLIASTLALEKCASTADTFCVTGTPSNGTTTFTIHAKGEWGGIGLGSEMQGAFIYVGFKNGNDNVVNSYVSRGRTLPAIAPNQVANIVPLVKPAPSWANTAFSFTVPHTTAQNGNMTPQSSYIWATGTGVTNPGSSTATFSVHTDRGVFPDTDFVTEAGTVENPVDVKPTQTTETTPAKTNSVDVNSSASKIAASLLSFSMSVLFF